jgi:exodeoxyribonuclease III
MKICSWNVNSLKARKDHVFDYLSTNAPDVIFLQELKGEEFPSAEFLEAGYHSIASTQKAYNGVAILSRVPFEIIAEQLEGDENDLEKRYLEIKINDVHFINIYLPNGNPVSEDSLKFPYKLNWMKRLYARVKQLRDARIPFLIGGDFNIIPEDIDCFDPSLWRGDALFRPESLREFHALLSLGLTDALRVFHNDVHYTFWDYQAGCWQKNNGIRIDHFLTSPPVTDRLVNCWIDKTPRGLEKPSDHTPIWMEIG